MEDLNAPFLGAFLDHLESTRANGARSRNLRLTALRSFFRYAALESPQHSGLIQRVLAIPNKRQPRPLVSFLTRPEIDALLADRQPWIGRAIMRFYTPPSRRVCGSPRSIQFDNKTSA
jgi:integrase/recombinase XerD